MRSCGGSFHVRVADEKAGIRGRNVSPTKSGEQTARISGLTRRFALRAACGSLSRSAPDSDSHISIQDPNGFRCSRQRFQRPRRRCVWFVGRIPELGA